jgi:DNA-binding CsgD family transcriptional regulator
MAPEITSRIRKHLEAVAKLVTRMPVILIDESGGYRLNGHAQKFISQKAISLKDFMDWVMIGASHLKNFSYDDMDIHMMHVPGGDVLVFLNEKEKNAQRKTAMSVLTGKEKEVLRLVIKGFSNKEIAASMKISPGTVKVHLDHIYTKLDCTNRVAAAFLGLKDGLFLPSAKY